MAVTVAASVAANPGAQNIVLPAGIQTGDVGFVAAGNYNLIQSMSAAPGGTAAWTMVRDNKVTASYQNTQRVWMNPSMDPSYSGGTISFTNLDTTYSGIIFVLIRGADLTAPNHHSFGQTSVTQTIWSSALTSIHTKPARRLFFGSTMLNAQGPVNFTPTGPMTLLQTVASTTAYYRISAYIHDQTQGSGTHMDTTLTANAAGSGVAGVVSIGEPPSRTHQMMM